MSPSREKMCLLMYKAVNLLKTFSETVIMPVKLTIINFVSEEKLFPDPP